MSIVSRIPRARSSSFGAGSFGIRKSEKIVGQDLAFDEALEAALLEQRNLLGVAEVGVGVVLDDSRLAVDLVLESSVEWIRFRGTAPMTFTNHRSGVVVGAVLTRPIVA